MSKKQQKLPKNKSLLQVKNIDTKANTADLYIYGEIVSESWYPSDTAPEDLIEIIPELVGVKNINLYINSPGGNVYAAIAIYNILDRLDADFTVYVDGIAASAATYFLGLGNVVMPANTVLYYHNPIGMAYGYANELRQAADDLDKHKEVITTMYVDKFNVTAEEISQIMDNETIVTAEKALELGIINEIAGVKELDVVENKTGKLINNIAFEKEKFENVTKKFNVKEVVEEEKQEEVKEVEKEPEPIDYTEYENSMKLTEDFLSLY